MASFKLNFAMIENCPEPREIASAMEEFGLPDTEEFGVLNCMASDAALYATLVRKTNQAIKKLDPETQDVATTAVERVNVLPIGIFPQRQTLEIYEGSATSIEQVTAFLTSCLALPVVVNPIEKELLTCVEKLRDLPRFQLKSIRISEHAHNSYMLGPYTPKFLDTENGLEFLEQNADFATSASVKFQGQAGRVTVNIKPKMCFTYSISNEDDKPFVQNLLRKLL